jgi:hypothetical protein
MHRPSIWFLAILVANSVGVTRADAQPDPDQEPALGSETLKAGFKPDPFKKEMAAGGTISTKLGGVSANVGKRPEFRLDYTGDGSPLTFAVESAGDTTLLIRQPDGKWIANADGCRGQIRLEKPQSGRYDIFVGSIAKENVRATLVITGQNLPAPLGKGNLPDCFVLTVGVDHYLKHNANRLNGCLNDARSTTQLFKAQQGTTFRKVEHETLLDEAATLLKIKTSLAEFAKRGTAGDYVVVLLSSHGGVVKEDGVWFFLPYDFTGRVASALLDDQLLDAVDALVQQQKHVILVVDSCHAGKLRQRAEPYLKRYKDMREGGLALMLACSPDQESNALGTCSAFSLAFVESLTAKGDLNKDGKIALGELKSYVTKRTPEILAEAKLKSKQDCLVDWSGAFSENTPLAATKTITFPPRKFVPPPLPRGSGNPTWDISALEKQFTVLRCTLKEGGSVISFELDLKDDITNPFKCRLELFDSDGVKIDKSRLAIADPPIARKDGRMVLNFEVMRTSLAKASQIKVVLE